MRTELIVLLEKFLQKEANAEEIIRLKELFTQAEAQNILAELYDEKWEQASFSPETEVEERIWAQLQKQISVEKQPVRVPLWKRTLRIAASIMIPLLCLYTGHYFSEIKPGQDNNKMIVCVEIGQKANMQLPDGTHVWLNSASSLTYDKTYNEKERVVYLQGEAYFEVSKDKKRPFIVKNNDISIEALGTSFNVKAYSEDNYITATLKEGSIRFSSPSLANVLVPNEKLTYSKTTGDFTKTVMMDTEKSTMWINNQLAFEQERLEDIIKVLERMYHINVHFTSDQLKNIRFSGTIKNNNLESVLQMIAFVSPIRYSLKSDSTVIISNP